jgi:hypothetical protein
MKLKKPAFRPYGKMGADITRHDILYKKIGFDVDETVSLSVSLTHERRNS